MQVNITIHSPPLGLRVHACLVSKSPSVGSRCLFTVLLHSSSSFLCPRLGLMYLVATVEIQHVRLNLSESDKLYHAIHPKFHKLRTFL